MLKKKLLPERFIRMKYTNNQIYVYVTNIDHNYVVSDVNVPMVGIVVTISPSFSLYRIVVFPAASRPTIKIRISFFPIRLFRRVPKMFPMVAGWPFLQKKKKRYQMKSY